MVSVIVVDNSGSMCGAGPEDIGLRLQRALSFLDGVRTRCAEVYAQLEAQAVPGRRLRPSGRGVRPAPSKIRALIRRKRAESVDAWSSAPARRHAVTIEGWVRRSVGWPPRVWSDSCYNAFAIAGVSPSDVPCLPLCRTGVRRFLAFLAGDERLCRRGHVLASRTRVLSTCKQHMVRRHPSLADTAATGGLSWQPRERPNPHLPRMRRRVSPRTRASPRNGLSCRRFSTRIRARRSQLLLAHPPRLRGVRYRGWRLALGYGSRDSASSQSRAPRQHRCGRSLLGAKTSSQSVLDMRPNSTPNGSCTSLQTMAQSLSPVRCRLASNPAGRTGPTSSRSPGAAVPAPPLRWSACPAGSTTIRQSLLAARVATANLACRALTLCDGILRVTGAPAPGEGSTTGSSAGMACLRESSASRTAVAAAGQPCRAPPPTKACPCRNRSGRLGHWGAAEVAGCAGTPSTIRL